MNAQGWLNLIIAAIGSLVAFGALNKMHWGQTRPCIMLATVLIAVGLAGQWLGLWFDQWLMYVDTALYGGILALLLATQRTESWVLERWKNPLASVIGIVAAIVLLFGFMRSANATPLYAAEQEGVVITLHDDACAQAAVTNLPRRATWDEAGQRIEGCWGAAQGLVLLYFADRTVGVASQARFQRMAGA